MSVHAITQEQLMTPRDHGISRPALDRPHLVYGADQTCGVAISCVPGKNASFIQLVYCDSDYRNPISHRETAICVLKNEQQLQKLLPVYIETAQAIHRLYQSKIMASINAHNCDRTTTKLYTTDKGTTLLRIRDIVSLRPYSCFPHPVKHLTRVQRKIDKLLQQPPTAAGKDDFHDRMVQQSIAVATDTRRKLLLSELIEKHPEHSVEEILETVDKRIPLLCEEHEPMSFM